MKSEIFSFSFYTFRKLLDKEPSFVKDYRMGRYSLYVVTEVFKVTKCEMKENITSAGTTVDAAIAQVVTVRARDGKKAASAARAAWPLKGSAGM